MKKISLVIFTAISLSFTAAYAQKATIAHQLSETTFEDVKIAASSTLETPKGKVELKPVAHGIRKKKVFALATVRVYVLEFLSANPQLLNKHEDKILASLKDSGIVELRLTMSRDLTGKKIVESFNEALEVNSVDIKNLSPELKQVMDEVSGISEFKTGDTFTLLASWKDAAENQASLFIQKPDGSVKTITGHEKFIVDLFSIWFGKPADGKLGELKKALLKQENP